MRLPRIACVDLDTFFVSVERLLDPSLASVPVVVGGKKHGGGVVVSCSYEARAFGVRSGMSIRDASQIAPPDAVFIPGHHHEYGMYSKGAREIVERYSPIVIAASIDEQYVDFRGCESLYREPGDEDDDATIYRILRTITHTIQNELGLPASAGLATSKSLAKVACGLAKPNGVRLVKAGDEESTLAPLGVRKLPGIGPVAEEKLAALGILTLADLVAASPALLRPIFGAYLEGIRRDARGHGGAELGRERPAFREYDPEGGYVGSISNERTFSEGTAEETETLLSGLSEHVSARARKRGVRAGCVTLRLRYTDFHTITRGRVITPTNVDIDIHHAVMALYHRARTRPMRIRLLGVQLSKLSLEESHLQLDLPPFDRGPRRVRTVDEVREKFGYDALHLASSLDRLKSSG